MDSLSLLSNVLKHGNVKFSLLNWHEDLVYSVLFLLALHAYSLLLKAKRLALSVISGVEYRSSACRDLNKCLDNSRIGLTAERSLIINTNKLPLIVIN